MNEADPNRAVTYWELDFSKDNELSNLKSDIDVSRRRLDMALFKHLAMLAPVAVGGMGMFLNGGSGGGLGSAQIAMIAVPAGILVLTVFLSALSLAIAPTNVFVTGGRGGEPVSRTRQEWADALREAALLTNWHRGFEDNVQFYGFAMAALAFLACGLWSWLS